MKGRNLILTALITLIAGALMLVYRNALASHGIVIGCGILFILAGVANMTVFLGERDKDGRARMSAAGTALGWVASAKKGGPPAGAPRPPLWGGLQARPPWYWAW